MCGEIRSIITMKMGGEIRYIIITITLAVTQDENFEILILLLEGEVGGDEPRRLEGG